MRETRTSSHSDIQRVVSGLDSVCTFVSYLSNLPPAPSLSSVSAAGYNFSAINVTATLEYTGSNHPISFKVDYASEVASVKTSGSRIFNDVKLDGLTWSGVVAGLTEYEAYIFNVTPITREGRGRSLVTMPTYPKAGTVQSNT